MTAADPYAPLRLKNQLCFPIYLCAKELVQKYRSFLDKLDLTYTQYIVMMYFWERGSSSQKQLSETLLLDPSTLTPLLKKLEAKGYLSRRRSPEDERQLILSPTEKGLALQEAALRVPAEMGACIGLSGSEAETLYRLIYKVLTNITEEKEHGIS